MIQDFFLSIELKVFNNTDSSSMKKIWKKNVLPIPNWIQYEGVVFIHFPHATKAMKQRALIFRFEALTWIDFASLACAILTQFARPHQKQCQTINNEFYKWICSMSRWCWRTTRSWPITRFRSWFGNFKPILLKLERNDHSHQKQLCFTIFGI